MEGKFGEAYKLLEEALIEIKDAGEVKEGVALRLSKIFDKRFQKALQSMRDGRVRRHVFKPSKRIVWMVTGEEGTYQVLPTVNFCSCNDFYFRVVNGETPLCYHVIAQKLAEVLNCFEVIEERDGGYEELVKCGKGS